MTTSLQALGRPSILDPACPHTLDTLLSSPLVSHEDLLRYLPTVGWPVPSSSPHFPSPPLLPAARTVTVSAASSVLLRPTHVQRQAHHTAFIAEAHGPLHRYDTTDYARLFVSTFRSAWRLPWENAHKETFWRLAVNGIKGSHIPGPCACGAAIPHRGSRMHKFWECPVALAVRAQVSSVVGPVLRVSVWLQKAPCPAVQARIWQVMCLAGMSACEFCRASSHSKLLGHPSGQSAVRDATVASIGE